METRPEMAAALAAGELTDAPDDDSGVVTVLAPVRDSHKDVAGFIEVSTAAAPPASPW
jgi:DNA-binding IclR family transcriptional regulator